MIARVRFVDQYSAEFEKGNVDILPLLVIEDWNPKVPNVAKTHSAKAKRPSSSKAQVPTSPGKKKKSSSKSLAKTRMLKPDILDQNPIDLKGNTANLGLMAEEK
ncbi:hypothetical protein PanWU01x14_241300, partial [Parasponia andersonii]